MTQQSAYECVCLDWGGEKVAATTPPTWSPLLILRRWLLHQTSRVEGRKKQFKPFLGIFIQLKHPPKCAFSQWELPSRTLNGPQMDIPFLYSLLFLLFDYETLS